MSRYRAAFLSILWDADLIGTRFTLGNGCPDETISASLWRMEQQGKRAGRWFRPVVDWLFFRLFGQVEHCWQSYVDEIEKRQLPKIYRKVSNYDTH